MMKGKQIIAVMLLFFVLLIGMANAATLIAGKIYNADFTETIGGAFVEVQCAASNKNTTSLSDGSYAVTFSQVKQDLCGPFDNVTVIATKDNLFGSASGIVNPDVVEEWDIAIVNVPLVPEFGLIVGLTTLIAAVVIFFVVRKH